MEQILCGAQYQNTVSHTVMQALLTLISRLSLRTIGRGSSLLHGFANHSFTFTFFPRDGEAAAFAFSSRNPSEVYRGSADSRRCGTGNGEVFPEARPPEERIASFLIISHPKFFPSHVDSPPPRASYLHGAAKGGLQWMKLNTGPSPRQPTCAMEKRHASTCQEHDLPLV